MLAALPPAGLAKDNSATGTARELEAVRKVGSRTSSLTRQAGILPASPAFPQAGSLLAGAGKMPIFHRFALFGQLLG